MLVLCSVFAAGASAFVGPYGQPGWFTNYTVQVDPQTTAGVNLATGLPYVTAQDVAGSSGNEWVSLSRTYNPSSFGSMGTWSNEIDLGVRLYPRADGTVTVAGPGGYAVDGAPRGDGTYAFPAGFSGALVRGTDGRYLLTRTTGEGQLRFGSSGKPAAKIDAAGRTFNIAYASSTTEQPLTMTRSGGYRPAVFSYTSTADGSFVSKITAAGKTYQYRYGQSTPGTRLTQYVAPGGATTTYAYEPVNGLLSRITLPGGVLIDYAWTIDPSHGVRHVNSMTITRPGEPAQTVNLTYPAAGTTDMPDGAGGGTRYSFGADYRLAAAGPIRAVPDLGDYTCAPAPTEAAPPDLSIDPGTGDDEPAPTSTYCPPGQEPSPVSVPDADKTVPDPGPDPDDPSPRPAAPQRYYAGYSQRYGGTTGRAPVDGSRANLSVHSPTVLDGSRSHSLAEIAMQSSSGQQIIEIGWRVRTYNGASTRPRLFVGYWLNGQFEGYNAGFRRYAGRRPNGSFLPVTGASGTKQFAIVHSSSAQRWNLYYGGRAIGYYPDSLWSSTGGFTQGRLVQWFGEVSPGPPANPCSAMGNGVRGTQSGSASFLNILAVRGNTSSPVNSLTAGPSNPYYDKTLTSANAFRYGGPTPSGC